MSSVPGHRWTQSTPAVIHEKGYAFQADLARILATVAVGVQVYDPRNGAQAAKEPRAHLNRRRDGIGVKGASISVFALCVGSVDAVGAGRVEAQCGPAYSSVISSPGFRSPTSQIRRCPRILGSFPLTPLIRVDPETYTKPTGSASTMEVLYDGTGVGPSS